MTSRRKTFRTAPFDVPSGNRPRREFVVGEPYGGPGTSLEQSGEYSPVTPTRVHPFGVPLPALKQAIGDSGAAVELVENANDADILVTTKSHYNRRPTEVRHAERDGVPVYVLRRGTSEQIAQFLRRFSPDGANGASYAGTEDHQVSLALKEAEQAIEMVRSGKRRVELSPQAAYIRRLQHGLAARSNVGSSSTGRDDGRRVVIRWRRR